MAQPVLSERDLTDLRENVVPLATSGDSCDITDPGAVTVTPSGGSTLATGVSGLPRMLATLSATQTGIPCMVMDRNAAGAISRFTDQQRVLADYQVMFDYGTSIRPGWLLRWHGSTYSVLDVADPPSYGVAVYALIRRSGPIGG